MPKIPDYDRPTLNELRTGSSPLTPGDEMPSEPTHYTNQNAPSELPRARLLHRLRLWLRGVHFSG